jgi:hypothetical protein
MNKARIKLFQSICVVAQGIADTANALSISEIEDVQDTLVVDLVAKFDLLDSAMLEV